MLEHGYIQIYTGDGKGKTTASLGLALRALGHGWKVLVIQFTKGDGATTYGEMLSSSKFLPNLTVKQFGMDRVCYSHNVCLDDYKEAKKGWEFAKEAINSHERGAFYIGIAKHREGLKQHRHPAPADEYSREREVQRRRGKAAQRADAASELEKAAEQCAQRRLLERQDAPEQRQERGVEAVCLSRPVNTAKHTTKPQTFSIDDAACRTASVSASEKGSAAASDTEEGAGERLPCSKSPVSSAARAWTA